MENPPSSPQSTLATSAVTHEIRSNVTVLRLTQPSLCSSLHQTVRDGKSIRAWSLVTTAAAPEVSFEDLATVPAALPPPPRETVRGRRGVGVQDDEFRFDYGYAFCLHRQDAFTKRGFPITCDGFICRGKTEVYSRKNPPFIWSRDRSRGGALVCPGKPGGRPHLYCLRCAEAQYEGGYALVNQTDGKPTCWEGLFTKYTVFPDKGVVRQSGPDALRNKGEGVGESEPGFDFWMQHRGVLCWHCSGEGLQAAKRTSGAKRPLILDGAGSSARSSARVKRARGTLVTPAKKAPQEAKVDGLLERLQQGVLLPTAITTGLFVLPSTTKEGDPLEIAIDRKGGLINTPRIVAVDHTGSFRCRCGSKACKEHDVSFLAEVREQESWWGPLLDEGSVSGIGAAHVAPYINERVVGQAFEVTAGCRAGRIPLSEGRLGARLVGADAAAWRGACLRAVIAITETGPAVCILREDTGAWVCGACERDQMCSHVRVASQLIGAEQKSALVEAKHEATPIGESVRSRLERVEERISQRNGRGTLRVGQVVDPCGAWGDVGFRQRSEQGFFCAPRPVARLAPCGKLWVLEGRQGTVTTAEGSHAVTVHRRICSGPAGVASCCSLSYDGLENGIFNFSGANLISHKVLLANHFANALGVTHQAGFEGLRMASASIDGPNGSFKLDDRTFASAIQAFNRLAAREIRHVCSGPECSNLYTSEVLASRREAEAAGEVWRPDPREGNFDALRTHAFTRDKVIVGDGTIFANASAMRDRSEKDIKGITQPSSEAPQIAGGFTPMGPGSQKPSGAPWPREERGCAYVFRNHFIDGMRDSVRSLAFRWANFRRIPGKRSQTGNEPLSTEEFAAMRGGLPESLRALVDLAAFPHPQCSPNCVACARAPKRPWMTAHRGVLATGWCPGHFHDLGALMHSLLTKDYSWIYCRILGLQLMRRLLLGGRALNSLELAYLRDDAPMIAAVLEFHSPELPTVQATDHGGHLKQYAFSPAVLPLMRDIYCTNLLAFEPSSNLRRATTPSPLRCLVDATDFLWGLEGVEAGGDEEWAAKEVRLCERAKLLLEELEVRDPIYYTNGTLRPASDEYKEQVERPSVYPFHPLLYERPHFIDWENTKGRSTKERLERHCALPERPHTKGHVGLFILVCQHRGPIGWHNIKGAESVSDFGTVLITRCPLETLKGLTVVEDCACQLQEWFLNRVPGLAKFMSFLVDRFHSGPVSVAVGNAAKRYSTHTCSPTLFIDSFPLHRETATTASEGVNSRLKGCKDSLQQITRLDDFRSRVTTILDINFERSKFARLTGQDAADGWLRRKIRELRTR